MTRVAVTGVWGSADGIPVKFEKSGDRWLCEVKADFSDGIYDCEFFAVNERGTVTKWNGKLGICRGVCHIDFLELGKNIFFEEPKLKFEYIKECMKNE